MARVPPQLVSVNGPQLAFLVGMNRIGCTWLARALNLHPQIAVFGQSRFWGKHYLTPDQQGHYGDSQRQRWLEKIAAFGWNATIGDELGCFPDVSVAQLRAALATSLERLATPFAPADAFRALAHAVAALKPQTAWVIEKTPHHVLHVPRILEALPQARFIVYRSTVTDHLRAWKSQADLLYHPAAVAVVWRRYRAACDWVERQLGDRAIVVDYDRLQHSPASELQSIQTFLGCDDYAWSSTLPPFYHGFCSTERLLALTAADRFWARRITGVDVSSGENRQPLDAAQIAASMCRLPVFALQHLWQNLPDVEGSWWAYYRKWLTTEK